MFSAFQTFGKLGAIGKAIAAAWSPLALTADDGTTTLPAADGVTALTED